eukprot:gene7473-7307_t
MKIQLEIKDTSNTTKVTIAERQAGQTPVKHTVSLGEKITVIIDGITLTGMAIPEANNGVNAAEAADGLSVVVTLPQGAAVGDVITVSIDGSTPVSYTVTASDVSASLNPSGTVSVLLPAADVSAAGQGAATVTTTYTDAAGNPATGGA